MEKVTRPLLKYTFLKMELIENTMEMSYSILFGSPFYEDRIKDKNKTLYTLLNVCSSFRVCVGLHHLVTVLIGT